MKLPFVLFLALFGQAHAHASCKVAQFGRAAVMAEYVAACKAITDSAQCAQTKNSAYACYWSTEEMEKRARCDEARAQCQAKVGTSDHHFSCTDVAECKDFFGRPPEGAVRMPVSASQR